MTLVTDISPKLRIPKRVDKQISEKPPFKRPLRKQHGKGDQTLLKSEPHPFYHIY